MCCKRNTWSLWRNYQLHSASACCTTPHLNTSLLMHLSSKSPAAFFLCARQSLEDVPTQLWGLLPTVHVWKQLYWNMFASLENNSCHIKNLNNRLIFILCKKKKKRCSFTYTVTESLSLILLLKSWNFCTIFENSSDAVSRRLVLKKSIDLELNVPLYPLRVSVIEPKKKHNGVVPVTIVLLNLLDITLIEYLFLPNHTLWECMASQQNGQKAGVKWNVRSELRKIHEEIKKVEKENTRAVTEWFFQRRLDNCSLTPSGRQCGVCVCVCVSSLPLILLILTSFTESLGADRHQQGHRDSEQDSRPLEDPCQRRYHEGSGRPETSTAGEECPQL